MEAKYKRTRFCVFRWDTLQERNMDDDCEQCYTKAEAKHIAKIMATIPDCDENTRILVEDMWSGYDTIYEYRVLDGKLL